MGFIISGLRGAERGLAALGGAGLAAERSPSAARAVERGGA